jgi:hypothetical protein
LFAAMKVFGRVSTPALALRVMKLNVSVKPLTG